MAGVSKLPENKTTLYVFVEKDKYSVSFFVGRPSLKSGTAKGMKNIFFYVSAVSKNLCENTLRNIAQVTKQKGEPLSKLVVFGNDDAKNVKTMQTEMEKIYKEAYDNANKTETK
jgi:hypothetical protein